VALDPFATEQDYVPTNELMPETHHSNNPTNPFSVAPPSIFGQVPVSRLLGHDTNSLFGNQNGSSNGSGNLFENLNDISFVSGVPSGSCKERGDGKRRLRKRRRGSERNNPQMPPTGSDILPRGIIPLAPPSSFALGFLSDVGPTKPAFGLVNPVFPVANKKKAHRRRRSRK
jgi:hypothetical protein